MKLILTKKQKLISLLALIIILMIIVILLLIKNNKTTTVSTVFEPVFLNEAQKISLNIKPETKVQVISRDSQGNILVYKVIKNNNDIITGLNQVNLASPSRVATTTEVNN